MLRPESTVSVAFREHAHRSGARLAGGAVRKALTILGILAVPPTAGAIGQPAGTVRPCARQSALWRHVFAEDSGWAAASVPLE
jgi:hypothetical protein